MAAVILNVAGGRFSGGGGRGVGELMIAPKPEEVGMRVGKGGVDDGRLITEEGEAELSVVGCGL